MHTPCLLTTIAKSVCFVFRINRSDYRVGRRRQNFFNKIITGDETYCFAYDPETK